MLRATGRIDAVNIDGTSGNAPCPHRLAGSGSPDRRAPLQPGPATRRRIPLQRAAAQIQGRRHLSGARPGLHWLKIVFYDAAIQKGRLPEPARPPER